MTGYGKHASTYDGRIITIELRTLNSKQADINLRMPSLYREMEFEIRDILSQGLNRGKIDVSIQRDLAPGESASTINKPLVQHYSKMLREAESAIGVKSADDAHMSMIMNMPDVFETETGTLTDEEKELLKATVEHCINQCQAFRKQEGEKLAMVLSDGVSEILQKLEAVEPFEKDRIERIRKRINGNLSDGLTEGGTIDQDRFEQELIYYLEKIDITEEKVSLKAHCDFFLKTLKDEEIKGKKLSFIGQEMGREINTLGSKAQHTDIQKLVVGMKDELEKIKEQVLNVL
ncbi:MAG: YicC family protein [Salibacteraceae bacterium]